MVVTTAAVANNNHKNRKKEVFMKKKIFTFILTLAMILSILPASTLDVSAATSAKTSSSSYCTVKISQSLLNKRGKQYAKVKIKTYDMLGWYNTGAKVRITLRDGNTNRYICSYVAKGGNTLKLGDDHRSYRIYVDYYDEPVTGGIFARTFKAGNNFTNTGSCHKWKISNPSNCTIY